LLDGGHGSSPWHMHSARIEITKNPSRLRRNSPLTDLRPGALHADVKRGHFLRPIVKRVTTKMVAGALRIK
jgi:hypothetical protein